jgi:hypothetical protein
VDKLRAAIDAVQAGAGESGGRVKCEYCGRSIIDALAIPLDDLYFCSDECKGLYEAEAFYQTMDLDESDDGRAER